MPGSGIRGFQKMRSIPKMLFLTTMREGSGHVAAPPDRCIAGEEDGECSWSIPWDTFVVFHNELPHCIDEGEDGDVWFWGIPLATALHKGC